MNAVASTIDPVSRINASSAVWQSTAHGAVAKQSVWERLKAVFSSPVKGVETLINARENFKHFFQQEMRKFGQSVPTAYKDSLLEEGQRLMQDILANSLNPVMEGVIQKGGASVGEAELRKAIQRAHEQAELAMMKMQSSSARARIEGAPLFDERPQIVVNLDQSIRLLRPAPGIENLVLRGGGAKGVSTAPALVEMQNAGLLTKLKVVVGTSVGGLTALSLASGHDANELAALTDKLDMLSLKDQIKNYDIRYPSVDVGCRVGFHTGRALELLDQISADSVSAYLDAQWNTAPFQRKLQLLRASEGDEVVNRLGRLRTQVYDSDRTHQMVTFKDLAMLHQLEPTKFKRLVLTGWDDTNNRMSYFSAETTPTMPVAVAGRISMSLPILFKSVTYDPGDGLGKRTFVDGGVGSNISSEAIVGGLSGQALADARMRTALMTFDQKGEAYKVMHQAPSPRSAVADWFMSKLSGNPNFGQAGRGDDSKLHDAGPNALVVFHGDIETLDLGASKERVERAKLQSSLKMLEQIEQRLGQASMVECSSVEHCFSMLTEAEKLALQRGGAPDPKDYARLSADPAYRFQSQLYEMARADLRPWSRPVVSHTVQRAPVAEATVDRNRFAAFRDELDMDEQAALEAPLDEPAVIVPDFKLDSGLGLPLKRLYNVNELLAEMRVGSLEARASGPRALFGLEPSPLSMQRSTTLSTLA